MLNLSNNQDKPENNPTVQFERTQFQAHAQTQMAISFFCRIHFASHRFLLVFAVNAALSLLYSAVCGPIRMSHVYVEKRQNGGQISSKALLVLFPLQWGRHLVFGRCGRCLLLYHEFYIHWKPKTVFFIVYTRYRRSYKLSVESIRPVQPNRVFSNDVTAAILVSQNNETAAMLVSQTSPVGVELFSYANAFFCSNKFA